MAETNGKRNRLIQERARALTIFHLTRRDDLAIDDAKEDLGLDLLVRLLHEEKLGLRQLGIAIHGIWKSVSKEHADKILRTRMEEVCRYGPFPFPVCLFLFAMEDDQGWLTWVVEPVVHADGTLGLHLDKQASCEELNNESLDQLLDRVDRWYDAFFGLIAGEPRSKVGKK